MHGENLAMIRNVILIAIVGTVSSAAYSASKNRPQIITEARYDCLMKHRTRLRAIGGDGTWFDLSVCPKKPRQTKGAFILAPSDKYIQLSSDDLACLGSKNSKAAVKRADKKVEIYTSPCGR
jgi:hypothetical protein